MIVLPAAVAVVIEVKKTLTSDELRQALERLAEANEALMAAGRSLRNTFTGVFAFTANEDLRPKSKDLSDTYGNRLRQVCQGHSPRSHVPDVIVVADEHVVCRREYQHAPEGPRFMVYRLPAEHGQHNVAVQGFLTLLFNKIGLDETGDDSGRFFFPPDLPNQGVQCFHKPDEPWPNSHG